MDAKRIAELRALCEAATPGPWYYAPNRYDEVGLRGITSAPGAAVYAPLRQACDPRWRDTLGGTSNASIGSRQGADVVFVADWTYRPANAAFIAAARTALPEALDEIERLIGEGKP